MEVPVVDPARTTLVGEPAARGRGRPRSARAESAILDTALEMAAEDGFAGITMEALAARAGVGKATIYRRWKKKSDLLIDAVMRVSEPTTLVDTGDLRADLITMIDATRRRMSSSVSGKIMPPLFSAAISDPELMQVYWERAVLPRREPLLERLRRAVERGETRAGLDPDMVCDLLVAPAMFRKLFGAVRALPTRVDVETYVDMVLIGIGPA